LFDLDITTGKAMVNSSYAQMLGYDFEDFEETNMNWIFFANLNINAY
jgi:hypothetical protein